MRRMLLPLALLCTTSGCGSHGCPLVYYYNLIVDIEVPYEPALPVDPWSVPPPPPPDVTVELLRTGIVDTTLSTEKVGSTSRRAMANTAGHLGVRARRGAEVSTTIEVDLQPVPPCAPPARTVTVNLTVR